MLEGLYAAAAGMSAQQQQLDAIGNDLANASTTGYKAERVGFRDLLYNKVEESGTDSTAGAGAAAEVIGRNGSQGAIEQTGNPLDLAIEGEGFFQVKQPNGQIGLTRDGNLSVDAKGQLTTAEGNLLDPPITLPTGTTPSQMDIAPDGTVSVAGKAIGKITLVTVASTDHLIADGSSQFSADASSGAPSPVASPTIHQGALEGSNVDVATEMTAMVSAQRNYQLESSAIQTENQMMSIANQLRTS
jgi:flagellar basal-body rod protein FlgG